MNLFIFWLSINAFKINFLRSSWENHFRNLSHYEKILSVFSRNLIPILMVHVRSRYEITNYSLNCFYNFLKIIYLLDLGKDTRNPVFANIIKIPAGFWSPFTGQQNMLMELYLLMQNEDISGNILLHYKTGVQIYEQLCVKVAGKELWSTVKKIVKGNKLKF